MKTKATYSMQKDDFSWIDKLLKNRLYFGEDVDWKFNEDSSTLMNWMKMLKAIHRSSKIIWKLI